MRTVAYYREQAANCQAIAKQISLSEPRNQLLKVAQEWDKLAADREAELSRSTAPTPEEDPDLSQAP
jgi:hypothetical protein